MGKTRNGIYHNLYESEYRLKTGNVLIYFSSQFYKDKFKEEYKINRDVMSYTFKRKYGMSFQCNEFYDIILYSKIEKRGFLLNIEGVYYECLENLILNGVRKIDQK